MNTVKLAQQAILMAHLGIGPLQGSQRGSVARENISALQKCA
jgi:hypothetical protein